MPSGWVGFAVSGLGLGGVWYDLERRLKVSDDFLSRKLATLALKGTILGISKITSITTLGKQRLWDLIMT